MKPINLQIVSEKGVEARILSDGSQGGVDDYYAVVSVEGFIKEQKIYGIDHIQSLFLGLKLIEQLTETKRIGDDDEEPMPDKSWHIEAVED